VAIVIIHSMTGFGRAEAESGGRKVTVEVKAVNHRFLDISVRMPHALSFTEEHIRKTIKETLSRGRVDVFLNYSTAESDDKRAHANVALIRSYVQAARKAAAEIGLEDDLALSHVVRLPDAILIEETPEDESGQSMLVAQALGRALEALTDMRVREGAALRQNMLECLEALEKSMRAIDAARESVPRDYAEKLRQRISELLGDCDVDEARLNTEIAYIADKADITEELVRLDTHIAQFRRALAGDEAVGRKLDFMVQEMNREFNTIGSKSQDMAITNAVIEGKSILEKIREQVQNIE